MSNVHSYSNFWNPATRVQQNKLSWSVDTIHAYHDLTVSTDHRLFSNQRGRNVFVTNTVCRLPDGPDQSESAPMLGYRRDN